MKTFKEQTVTESGNMKELKSFGKDINIMVKEIEDLAKQSNSKNIDDGERNSISYKMMRKTEEIVTLAEDLKDFINMDW